MSQFKPLASVLIIIVALFTMVFFQLEVRRMGYVVLKQAIRYKSLEDHYQLQSLRLTRILRPEHLQSVAINQLTMDEPLPGQVIHMSGSNIALRQ